MKKTLAIIIALLVLAAFADASFAVTAKKVGIENPENAKQGFTPDKTKTGVTQDMEPKAKVDKSKVGKNVQQQQAK